MGKCSCTSDFLSNPANKHSKKKKKKPKGILNIFQGQLLREAQKTITNSKLHYEHKSRSYIQSSTWIKAHGWKIKILVGEFNLSASVCLCAC